MNKWLIRMIEHINDKVLADKCGLEIKDICVHELEPIVYSKLDTIKMWRILSMIIINGPVDGLIECKCYKCGTVIKVHPALDSNVPFIKDCELHKKKDSKDE